MTDFRRKNPEKEGEKTRASLDQGATSSHLVIKTETFGMNGLPYSPSDSK
jgi:hypothetical protein